MRLVRAALVLAALAACAPDVCVTGETPKPSAPNNQPATPAPAATTVRPAGQPPAPPAGAANATPPPGQTTQAPKSSAPPAAPAPAPSSPTPTTAAPSTTAPPATPAVAATPAPVTRSADSSSSNAATPAPTELPVATNSESDSSGMSAGSIIGIILAVLAVVGVGGFFLFRYIQSRRGYGHDDDGHHGNKHFDYPANTSPQEVTIMGSQQSDYTVSKMERASSQDMPIMAAGGGSTLSSLNNSSYTSGTTLQNTYNSNSANNAVSNTYSQYSGASGGYGNSNNNSKNNNDNNKESSSMSSPAFAKSTSRYLKGPDQESPPFKKTEVQLSRPSSVLLDEPMEFNHSFAESYAESYSESFSDRGYMSSFVQGMAGGEGLSVGATSAMGDALDRDTATHTDNAHWLDAMRDTGDSYAMLEADAYGSERGSAISRFSTDSEYNRESQL